MFSDIPRFILDTAFTLFGAALAARIWIYAARLHPFNPFAQLILQVTNWLVTPLRSVVAPRRRLDTPTIVAIWLTALLHLLLMRLLSTGELPPLEWLPSAFGVAALTALKWGITLVFWLTLAQAVLSWVNPLAPIMPVLQTLLAPLLAPIRRILPRLGMLDFSPLVLIILAQSAELALVQVAYRLFGV